MSTTPMSVEDALTLAMSSLSEYVNSQWQIWANDDTGTLTAVHQSGVMVNAQVHDSGVLEYWAELPEPPPIEVVLDALLYIEQADVPVELSQAQLVGVVEFSGGGGGGVGGNYFQFLE